MRCFGPLAALRKPNEEGLIMSHRNSLRMSLAFLLTFAIFPLLVHGAEPVEVEIQKNVVYGTGAGEDLQLDLAMPKGLDHAVPGIVWIHGGAWRGGSKNEFERLIRESAQAGYVAISIGYRLAPKHIFPAQVE